MTDRDPFPVLDTPRLQVRCVVPGDAPAISALMTEALSRWLGNWPVPFTPAMAAARIAEWGALARGGRGMPCVLSPREGLAVAGWIHCLRFGEENVASMGYWCGERFGGRGYVREAALALVPAAFRFLGVDAIEASVQPGNEPSLAVVRVLGMRSLGEAASFSPARNRIETVLRFRLERPPGA